MEKVKEYKAWFSSHLELDKVGDILVEYNIIKNYEFDYENVYEWLICDTENEDLELNISRKHCNYENFENENIAILFVYYKNEPSNDFVEFIAKEIEEKLNTKVILGEIEYLGGDNYKYCPKT